MGAEAGEEVYSCGMCAGSWDRTMCASSLQSAITMRCRKNVHSLPPLMAAIFARVCVSLVEGLASRCHPPKTLTAQGIKASSHIRKGSSCPQRVWQYAHLQSQTRWLLELRGQSTRTVDLARLIACARNRSWCVPRGFSCSTQPHVSKVGLHVGKMIVSTHAVAARVAGQSRSAGSTTGRPGRRAALRIQALV